MFNNEGNALGWVNPSPFGAKGLCRLELINDPNPTSVREEEIMHYPKDDNELDKTLSEAFTPPPPADFDAWQQRHPEAAAWLNPQRTATLLRRRRIMSRTIVFATTAAVAICAWLGVTHFDSDGPGTSAFAQTLDQIQKAKTITWKSTVFTDIVDKDERIQWVESSTSRKAFRAPGLYRREDLDHEGKITFACITDNVGLRELQVNHRTKEATLREMTIADEDPRGPFLDIAGKRHGGFEWVGTKELAGRKVNVFRYTRKDDRRKFREVPKMGWTQDYWVDAKTKRLVRLQWPGADIYNPDKDPLRNNPREANRKGMSVQGIAWVLDDIVYDAELDDSLFSQEPPKGYALKIERRPQVTEKDMVEHLRLMAEYYNNMFSDRYDKAASEFDKAVCGRAVPAWFPPDEELEAFERKPERDRTPAQNQIVEARQHYIWSGLNLGPFRHFIRDNTVEGTWQYLGKGVRLGDKNGIVCWYKLKDAKNPDTYRVVYGDLSVKDVAPEDLPLPVGL